MNLEREVLNLADMVHFTDNQASVYSVRISDLLIRCNVEVESLVRELYKTNYNDKLDSVGSMLLKLNKDWILDKKIVSITSTNMHYSVEYSSFCPFSYEKKDKDDFYSAYNAVKHDRSNNFEKYATIHYLLRALGALFILNVYYRQEEVDFLRNNFKIDSSLGSKIFSFYIEKLSPKYPEKSKVLSSDEELGALYIIKPSEKIYSIYIEEFERVFNQQIIFLESNGFKKQEVDDGEDNENTISYDEVYKVAGNLGGASFIKKISELENSANKKYQDIYFKAVVNKQQKIHYCEIN